ncbi:HTH domain-containing protein [Clostridioides sp. ZZV15-6598]|uniref:HTH domain-containing protein n=1 Tax=Clostridioides sp. ZZV15-6598 TaxID=2811501 RepID=UPI001D129C73|nr:HTH domain-containing protein [Clostridioides sp. ZZV15-6598]
MGKIDNAFKIIILLRKNETLKSGEISDILNISERQIKEYVHQLRLAGIDIKSKPGVTGGYHIDKCPFCNE